MRGYLEAISKWENKVKSQLRSDLKDCGGQKNKSLSYIKKLKILDKGNKVY